VKVLLRELPADFQPNTFIGTGNECDWFHKSIDPGRVNFQEAAGGLPAKDPAF
jgi:hypothetical protein